MTERGVFAVDRGIWEHDLLLEDAPFSRREAWLWIISEAAWKPHRRRIIGRVFELERGQLVASLRFIASKWRWSEARVRRFLDALISEMMVVAKTDAGVTVITVCKYNEYQRVSAPSDAMREDDVDAGATQERRKVEDKEDKEEEGSSDLFQRSSSPSGGREATRPDGGQPAKPDTHFDEFWRAYPKREGSNPKQPALKKFKTACRAGADPAAITAGARRFAAELAEQGKIGTPYVPQATRWLNEQRWTDYTEPIAAAASSSDEDLPVWVRNATPEYKRQYRESQARKANGQG